MPVVALVCAARCCCHRWTVRSAQSGTIRFIVGLVPGGAVDPYARIIAEHMAKTLGQTIIVENKPGAGGNISAQMMTEAPANGQMVWVSTQALTEINPSAYTNLRWSIDDFQPIIKGVQAPLVFVAHPSVPASNLAEFVTWAKANRGKQSYASYTAGTPSHFLGFLLNEKFDLDLTHVPYRGSGLQVNGLIAGHSLFGFAQVNSTLPQKRAGTLKVFASTGPERDRSMPDVPTFAELGPSGIHDAGLVRSAGEGRHAARHRQPADRSREGRACRSGGAAEARSPGLRRHRRNRAATSAEHQGTDRALGQTRQSGGVLGRGSRQHAIGRDLRRRRRRHSPRP